MYCDAEKFDRVKLGVRIEIQARLDELRETEYRLKGPIQGYNVEGLLRHIARRCRVRNKNLYYGIDGYIDSHFSMEQKKVLYEILNRIVEDRRWGGVDWLQFLF